MVHVMGCDPHLDTFTAAVLDPLGRVVIAAQFTNTARGWAEAVALAHRYRVSRVGIEAASGYGRSLARAVDTAGLRVIAIPTRLTAHGRKRHGKGKTDILDAQVVAHATAVGEGSAWVDDPDAEALRVLVHRRRALVTAQTRDINQLRALLAEIDPERAAQLGRVRSRRALTQLSRVRYHGDPHRHIVAQLIRDAATDCLQRHTRIRWLTQHIHQHLTPAGWALTTIPGIGIIGAATIIAELAGTDGFRSDRQFAAWAGVAPLDASSGRQQRHRLNRGGNRAVNTVLRTAILTQQRHGDQAAHYIQRRRHQGKTHKEATRALQRHLARRVWKTLQLT